MNATAVVTRARWIILAAVVAGALLLAGLVHVDAYPALHTFGYSVGTDSHYCSADLVNFIPRFSCEAAS